MVSIRNLGPLVLLTGAMALAQTSPQQMPQGQMPGEPTSQPSGGYSRGQTQGGAPRIPGAPPIDEGTIVVPTNQPKPGLQIPSTAPLPAAKPWPKLSDQPLTKETRVMLVRSLSAETVFARRPLPTGQRGVALHKNGVMTPSDNDMAKLLLTYGAALKPGDRAQITDVQIHDKSIVFELNGGPKKKKKWYQHLEVGGLGGSRPVSQQTPEEENAKGTTVELVFDKFVPEMTGDQVRELLDPVLNFKAQSAAEAYIDTVPPKVKQAIKEHQVLVGMNKEMVTISKGRPEKKIRENDTATGKPYEEWIYGEPPQEVAFVRFNGDEVVRLELMGVDGQKTVKTEKEVEINNGLATLAQKAPEPNAEDDKKPVKPPTLVRPGETPDVAVPRAPTYDPTSRPRTDEGEWGKPKTDTSTSPPPPTSAPSTTPPPK
jgi:hypothetical protein